MDTAVKNPPRTLMEVFRGLPEGTLAQLIENNLVMTPAPLDIHQKILNEINILLFTYIKQHQLGEVRIAPYGVYLDGENAFQPDIVFINRDQQHIIREDGLYGAPDLVVEILSPSTQQYDLGKKKDVYERSGVKEYCVVDPETKKVRVFSLENNIYGKPITSTASIPSLLFDKEFEF